MKKQLQSLSVGALLICGSLNAQNEKRIQPCVTYDAMEQVFNADPSARQRYEAAQAILQTQKEEYEKNLTNSKTLAPPVYTIPVVFHILHQGGSENISDATVIQALDWMNKDYARANSDASTTAQPFNGLYVDSEIKFVLAKLDPNGNCTNGIVHKYDARTNWDRNPSNAFSYLYNGITWNPTRYMNIIIVKDIVAAQGQTGIVVGYTFKPGSWASGAVQDAIVYNAGFLGTMVNARSLSHEAGHWLNLSHTWGNTNNPGVACGNDGISDTPITKGEFGGCPSSSVSACAETYNNVQNIMNYSDCPRNFTQGQTNAMRAALVSSTSGRNNLWSGSNLTTTGINNTAPCAPIADFTSTTDKYQVCSGGSLTMKDASYNGTITSWTWSGPSGVNFASATSSISAATFNNPGVVTITLTASNTQGSSSSTRTVNVIDGTAAITSYTTESFEGSGLPANWSINNPNGVTWAQTNIASKDGANSYFVEGPNSAAGQSDILQLPIVNMNNVQNGYFEFACAYARNSTTHNDNLLLQGSLDCGATWKTIKSYGASQLANGSGGVVAVTNSVFIPTSSQWKTWTSDTAFGLNLSTDPDWFDFQGNSSVMIRFNFTEDATTGGGNRIYIDKVQFVPFGSGVGINELTKSIALGLFPNPTKGNATVKFTLSDVSNINIDVTDILGRTIIPGATKNYAPGTHNVVLNSNSSLSKGIYFVNITLNGAKMSRKLIVE